MIPDLADMTSPATHYATHNVAELEPASTGGLYLRRFPGAVRRALSPLGRMVAEESAGVEIRFVTEGDAFRLSLGAEPFCLDQFEFNTLDVFIFRGDFFHSRRKVETGRINPILVTDIGGGIRQRMNGLGAEALKRCRFSPEVWRIFLGRFPATLIELSTFGAPCRAPLPTEVPAKRWLAYGSSITNGGSASAHPLAYIYQAAHRLGVDVYNQGLSGSCHCEPEVADYFASRQDWDLITLELGVNMRQGFTPEEFEKRASHLVHTVAQAHPERPIALLSIYPNADLPPACDADAPLACKQLAFNEALRRIAATAGNNVHLIDGSSILQTFHGLSTDLIHPGDYGHIEMGQRLAESLKALLN